MKKLNFFSSLFIALVFETVGIFTSDLSFVKNKYFDTEEDIKFRREYNSNYTNLITKGNVVFEYSPLTGTYCKTKKHISPKEFVFQIPKEFLICGFDIFPFKFEIKDALFIHLNQKYQNNHNETKAKASMFLFTYSLLFHRHANKTKVNKFLNETGKTYYINDLNEKQQGYLDSISSTLYTFHMYDAEERKMMELIGMSGGAEDLYDAWNFMSKYFKNHQLSEYIYHWINDFHQFRLITGIIASRSYRATLSDYEKLNNKSLLDFPAGGIQKQLLNEVSNDFAWSCLLPFIDLCNHKGAKDPEGKDRVEFYLVFSKDFVKISFSQEYQPEEEYSYSYILLASNEKLLLSYGFYFDNNPLSVTAFETSVLKVWFTKEKYEVCKKIGCLEGNYDGFYTESKLTQAPVKISLYPHILNNKILDAFRLYVQPIENFNAKIFENRLRKGKWVSYSNEITALTLLHYTIDGGETVSKLNSFDILNSIQLTRNYYKENRDQIIQNQFYRYKYRMRRKIINVAIENRLILFKNQEYIQNNMSKLLKDQFAKLKNAVLLEVLKR